MAKVEFESRILIDRHLFEWIFDNLGGGKQSRIASNLLRVNKYSEDWSGEHIVISKRDFEKVQEIDELNSGSKKMQLIRGGLEIQDLSDKTPKKHLHKRSVHAILLSEKKPHQVSVLTTEEKEEEYSNNQHLDDYESVNVICGEEALELLDTYREKVKTRRDLEASGIR